MTPYAVKIMGDHLRAAMPGVRVATKVPADKPDRLVTITTAPAGGSPKPDYLSWRRLILQCADTAGELATAELCEQVRTQVLAARFARIGIRKVAIVGEPADFPDPDDATPRFQLTVDALMRATP